MASGRHDTPRAAPQRGQATAVVCAAFDAATDALVERLRARVADAGLPVRRAHRPHLTLAAARVADAGAIVTLAGQVAARHRPLALTMTGLDSFPSGVLWVRPADSAALRALQRDAHDTLRAAGCVPAFGPTSAPGQWTAHCTLATRVPEPVLRRLRQQDFAPFAARVDALAVLLVGGRGDVGFVPLGG